VETHNGDTKCQCQEGSTQAKSSQEPLPPWTPIGYSLRQHSHGHDLDGDRSVKNPGAFVEDYIQSKKKDQCGETEEKRAE
jgi:hypothetical protein